MEREDIERGGGRGGEVSVWDQKWKREREMETGEETGGRDNTAGMDSSTGTLTLIHRGDTPDIPCREVSVELIRTTKPVSYTHLTLPTILRV